MEDGVDHEWEESQRDLTSEEPNEGHGCKM